MKDLTKNFLWAAGTVVASYLSYQFGAIYRPFTGGSMFVSNGIINPTLRERVQTRADLNGNCNGQPDVAEMVDIWQRAGYSLSFNPEHRLVAQRGTETIVFGNEFKDPQLSNADLEKVLASYK
ncbi:hypothetical protein J4208_04270 [Candidatus Woesearchaeota archaeon]|nr:hypothetical protein [Candidatus Woesearchaeota archaeon]